MNFSAFIPLYFTKPITAKGTAVSIHTQLTASKPISGLRMKYENIDAARARTANINCRRVNPKNIDSVYSRISRLILTSIIFSHLLTVPSFHALSDHSFLRNPQALAY